MANYKPILSATFKFEGGYQNSPNDSANYTSKKILVGTNRGISAIALEEYWRVTGKGGQPTVADIKALTSNDAEKIYKKLFWDKIKGNDIKNQSVAWIIFDSFIASGSYGIKRTKTAINKYYNSEVVTVNSNPLNDAEVKLINDAQPQELFKILKDGEIQNRKNLAASDPTKAQFLKGWLNRLDAIEFVGSGSLPILFLFNKIMADPKLKKKVIIGSAIAIPIIGIGLFLILTRKSKSSL